MEQAIRELITEYPVWKHTNGKLVGEWKLQDFTLLRRVVSQLCDLAEVQNHHPTVTYGYNTLRIETTTHDAGNIVTGKDIEFARRVSEMLID